MHHPTDRIAHTTAFVAPVVEHWLEREIWNVMVNDGLSTFYLRLYLVGHMVKDHPAREETRCRYFMNGLFSD